MKKQIKYILYKEDDHFVAQCLNVDVSSFGDTLDEAVKNITEAVELYYEGNPGKPFSTVEMAMIGEHTINV